jgi:hypothetical protein
VQGRIGLEMGIGGTGHRAMGQLAVNARAALPLLAAGVLLSGCKAVPQIAGVLSGATVGAATGSPALGFAVGVATDSATNAGIRYFGRSRQHGEQNAIAEVAGELPVGASHPWRIEHTIPFGNEHGELYVVRAIDTPLALCKEIVFSVDEGKGEKLKRAWYTASVCHQEQGWRWATAEPAVPRWGYLQ